jgi:hypothetical protein
MAGKDSVMRAAILLLVATALRLDAQVVETPIAFDNAGKMRNLTPGLVARLDLRPPTWPVQGEFVEARLFSVSSGGSVLVVERRDRQVERYPLTEQEVATLRNAVNAGMAQFGGPVGDDRPEAISEPARGAFVRDQMLVGALWYGPLLAALPDDPSASSALYLLTVGATYFIASGIANSTTVSRAQNSLASDGAVRGALATGGALYALFGEELDGKVANFVSFAGAVGGAMTGFQRGKRMTDSEAQATMFASTASAATALGVLGGAGLLDDNTGSSQLVVASIVGAGLTGYALGPRYPRSASYTVTAGDVRMLRVSALLGIMVGVTPFVEFEGDENGPFMAATAGMLSGIFLADRAWVRPYDHTSSDATQVWLGTIAGGLMGGALVTLAKPSATVGMALVTAGAILGAIGGQNMAKPEPARMRSARLSGDGSRRLGSIDLRFTPENLALAAAKMPGQHPVVTLRF